MEFELPIMCALEERSGKTAFLQRLLTVTPDFKQDFHTQIAALKKDKRRLQGIINHLVGKFAELQLAGEFRTRKRFRLSLYSEGITDTTRLNLVQVTTRPRFLRANGKQREVDVVYVCAL